MTILVIEDEEGIVRFLRRGFEAAGYPVLDSGDGATGLALAQRDDVRLVVLDLGLPGTAKDTVADKVANLEAGADDYVVKPFSFSELLARVRARLRATDQPTVARLEAGDLTLDLLTRRVAVGGRSVDLSTREFALAEVLVRHAGQVLSKAQLLDQVWGYDFDGGSNVVEVYVRHLRRKLGAERIETVRGAGYRLVAP